MFCPKCGAELSNDAEFCIKCGTKISAVGTVQQANAAQADVPTKAKKKKSKLPIILGAAILLIIIVIAVSSQSSGEKNSGEDDIDYITTLKAYAPYADTLNLSGTFSDVFEKYLTNPTWKIDPEVKKTNGAIVAVEGTVKGSEHHLSVSMDVSQVADNPDVAYIRPYSMVLDGAESTDQEVVAELLLNMFTAYDEGSENISELLNKPSSTDQILGVTGGTNSAYPGVTYGEAFENFFSNPSWEYFVGIQDGPDEDGDGEPDYTVDNVAVVEFTGDCLYANAEVTALIQFVLDNDAGTFQPVYLSFNGVPQNMLMLSGLIDTVFSQAMENQGLIPPQSSDNSNSENSSEPTATSSASELPTGQSGYNRYDDYNLYVFEGSYSNESIGIDLTVQPNETEFYCELYWYYGRMIEVGDVCPGVPTQLSEGTTITIDLETNGGIHVLLEGSDTDPFSYEFDLFQ